MPWARGWPRVADEDDLVAGEIGQRLHVDALQELAAAAADQHAGDRLAGRHGRLREGTQLEAVAARVEHQRVERIMPEIGENPVADEMYNMVFEYAENTDEDVVEVVRCKDCIHHRQLDRTDSYEDSFIEGCLWCMLGRGDGVMPEQFCDYGAKMDESEDEE